MEVNAGAPNLKIGEFVKMVNCLEAESNPGKVFKVISAPWDLCGTEVVLLEGYRGGVDTSKLEIVSSCEAIDSFYDAIMKLAHTKSK